MKILTKEQALHAYNTLTTTEQTEVTFDRKRSPCYEVREHPNGSIVVDDAQDEWEKYTCIDSFAKAYGLI